LGQKRRSYLSLSSQMNFFRGPITLFPGFSSSSSSEPFFSPSSDCCLNTHTHTHTNNPHPTHTRHPVHTHTHTHTPLILLSPKRAHTDTDTQAHTHHLYFQTYS